MDTGTTALVVGAAAGVISALAAVLVIVLQLRGQNKIIQRQNREQLKKQTDFERDWFGEEARPGVAERPGMMERVRRIEMQMKPNGGESLRDALTRVEREQIFQRGWLSKIESVLKKGRKDEQSNS